MERFIDTMLTPQIASENVAFSRLTVLSAPTTVSVGGSVNKVSITDGSACVYAVSNEVARQGLKYIRQLQVLFDGSVPVCEFEYYSPAFGYRGFLIDVCRHFLSVEEILRIIDMMSLIGFNTFHWHLTDDQGWRFSVPGYPLLKKISSSRKNEEYIKYHFDYKGFYSDEDLRRVVAFAAERGMTVVPEIETPGHATALLAAYPEFGCTGKKLEVEQHWGIFKDVLNPASPELWTFLDKAIGKLSRIFPGPYIHIGGDECPHDQWKENKDCQALMKREGIKTLDELQGWFTTKAAALVAKHGKRAMGWDEVVDAPSIDRNVVVMSWRGLKGAKVASKRGHNVILCPQQGLYFDKGYTSDDYEPAQWGHFSVKETFSVDLGMKELSEKQRALILGAQCNIWTELITSGRDVEYMIFPRAFALSDSMWLGENKNWEKCLARRNNIGELCWKMDILCSPVRWEDEKQGGMQ